MQEIKYGKKKQQQQHLTTWSPRFSPCKNFSMIPAFAPKFTADSDPPWSYFIA